MPRDLERYEGGTESEKIRQDRTQAWAAQFGNCPILDGRQIDGIELTAATAKKIAHGLNRKPRGWHPVDQNAAADIHRSEAWDPEFLTLTASANVTVSLWVY